ncbi:MAG: thiamine phosphate synthase [Longimicrobiales bacterium]|nr:thiamine phosphate synthase [Longimicrobiales bacterium]
MRTPGVGGGGGAELRDALALVVITDRRLAAPRDPLRVVEDALRAGCRAVQLRAKDAAPAEILRQAHRLRALTRAHGALLFINDRVDVALAAEADGVHLGPADLPVDAVRRWVGARLRIGFSTDEPHIARAAERAGADYLGCGAVFGTRTKDVGGEEIGPDRLDAVARAVAIPVIGIGGITPENADRVAGTRAAGAAVVGSVMAATDPGAATRALLAPFRSRIAGGG